MKTVVSLLVACVCSSAGLLAAESELPNVVYIMADDLGIGDVKCYGGERCAVETPGFDRLAAEGVRFTDAHVVTSVCVPSRLAIMTGRYPWRFEPPSPDGRWAFLMPRMDLEQFTVADLMQQSGYRTAYTGKWHLGTEMVTTDNEVQGIGNVDYQQPLRIGPNDYGFGQSMILPGSLDMFPYVFVRDHRFVGDVTATKGWSAFNRQGPAAEDFEDTKVLDTITREAEQFIEAASEQQETSPFFLYVGLTSPHTPVSPSRAFEGKSELGLYGDFLMETDDCVKRVLDALDRHGLADNTLVIATSDHGPAAYAGNIRKATFGQLEALEAKGHDANLDFRGYKFSLYEGGLRVPFVARWPKVAPAGEECRELIGLQDLMATLAEITGSDLDDAQGVDSISWLPLLKDPGSGPVRDSMIMTSGTSFAIRKGPWKLIVDPGSGCAGKYGNRPTRDEAWGAAIETFGGKPTLADLREAPFVQLYHMRKDPGEWNSYAANFPPRVAAMLALLEEQIENGRSTPGQPLSNEVKVDIFRSAPGAMLKK